MDRKVHEKIIRTTQLTWALSALIAPVLGALSYQILGYKESMRVNFLLNGFLLVIFIFYGFFSQSQRKLLADIDELGKRSN